MRHFVRGFQRSKKKYFFVVPLALLAWFICFSVVSDFSNFYEKSLYGYHQKKVVEIFAVSRKTLQFFDSCERGCEPFLKLCDELYSKAALAMGVKNDWEAYRYSQE
jgi:hypothetical protein